MKAGSVRSRSAGWKRVLFLTATVAIGPALASSATAVTEGRHDRIERDVIPAAAGPNRLEVDVPLLVGCFGSSSAEGRFHDFRLFNLSGREVPYLVIQPPVAAPRWKSGTLLSIASTKETSGFEVDLGASILCDRLKLEGLSVPHLKRARLEGSGDRARWTVLSSEATLFDLPDEHLRFDEIPFRAGEYRYLRVIWNDSTSGRLAPPEKASVRWAQSASPADPMRIPVAMDRRSSEPGKSRFAIRLPGPLPAIALGLDVQKGNLLRSAEVTEARLSSGEVNPVTLGRALLRQTEREGISAGDLRIPLAPSEGPELELTIDDENNPPLAPSGAWVEITAQPWIYFEANSTEKLVARYGGELDEPHYDLEAARETARKSNPPQARWGSAGNVRTEAGVVETGAAPAAAAALVDVAKLSQSRSVPPSPPGLTALVIDAEVLSHCRADLGDLRIVDAKGRQVPYLLERRNEPLAGDLPPLDRLPVRKEDPAGLSRYRLTLPFANLPASQLVLATRTRIFERSLTFSVARPGRDAREDPQSEVVASAHWRHSIPEVAAADLVVQLPALDTRELTISIDEGDNAPLTLSSPRLLLPTWRLRFVSTGDAALTLRYGQSDLSAPRYDLALLAPRLTAAAARELRLAPSAVAQATAKPPGDRGKKLFWGALVVAVLILSALMAKLLGKET